MSDSPLLPQCAERNEGGSGLATAGIAISIVEMVIVAIYIIIVFAAASAYVNALI